MRVYLIYLVTNSMDGKVYVGQTCQTLSRRWGLHKSKARTGSSLYLHRAIRLYGEGNFSVEVLSSCETPEWANYLEKVWILIKDSFNPKKGYNLTTGGDRPSISSESIEKQRQKMLGRKVSEETRKRLSESLSLAYKEGRHPGTSGRPATENQLKGLAVGWGQGNGKFRKDILSEELLFLWNNGVQIKDIAKRFKIDPITVNNRIRSLDLPYRMYKPGGKFKELDEELMVNLFLKNLSLREIGRQVGRSHNVIRRRLEILGLLQEKIKY